jgi:shikimate dehydrogenase
MSILSGQARVAGIAGWPVAHSRSPRIHGLWLQRYGIDGTYIPLPIRPEDFRQIIPSLKDSGFAGVNVTFPHKLAAFQLCDRVDDVARQSGAVNTLVFDDGEIAGMNTDGFGFIANLRDYNVDPAAGPALLLGAGGSARAIATVLLQQGAAVTVCNRSEARAEEMARDIPGVRVVPWVDRMSAICEHVLLINTTPLGMVGQDTLELDLSSANPRLVVADIVYVPVETPLLRAARRRGLRTVDGLGMLLHQARPGFTAWFGVDPVVDEELRTFVTADLTLK